MTRLRTSATVSGRARPRCLITHCTELPTAIARTDSDWTQLGMRSPLRLRAWTGSPQMLNSCRTSPSSYAKT